MISGPTAPREFSETDADLPWILGATVEAAPRLPEPRDGTTPTERATQQVRKRRRARPLESPPRRAEVPRTRRGDGLPRPLRAGRVRPRSDRTPRGRLPASARGETVVEDAEGVGLRAVTTEAWGYVDTAEASLAVSDGLPTVTGDLGRLTQLFESLFRNAVERGGNGVRSFDRGRHREGARLCCLCGGNR